MGEEGIVMCVCMCMWFEVCAEREGVKERKVRGYREEGEEVTIGFNESERCR